MYLCFTISVMRNVTVYYSPNKHEGNFNGTAATYKPAYIIVDTQPLVEPTKRMIEEAKAADLILLLCSDSPLDIHATTLTVKNLLKTKSLKSKTHLLFSRVVKGTGLSLLLNDHAKTIGVKRLKSIIHFRNCYRLAPLKGWSALNRVAKEEVQTLTIEALTLMLSPKLNPKSKAKPKEVIALCS